MEMWLKRSTLLLLTVAAQVISDQAPVILEEKPGKKVEVPFGSSLTFHCRLKMNETKDRFWVFWNFIPSGSPSNGSILHKEMVNKSAKTSTIKPKQSSKDEERDTEETLSTYTLSNATGGNSGWYFCNVNIDIPLLIRVNSSGREVVITKSIEHATYQSPIVTSKQATVSPKVDFALMDHWMWILLGVSVPILIVLLVICVLLRKKRSRFQGEDPIYANTRPNPSPRPGEKLKTVSSSQNLRNPSPGRRYDEGKQRYRS